MAQSLAFTIVLMALFLCGNMFSRRSPYMQGRMDPAHEWADGPVPLVETPWMRLKPSYAFANADMFTKLATHLALVDNALIRGYNSIYRQAALIEGKDDVSYFADYALTWSKFMKVQDADEDNVLFVKLGEILLDEDPLKQFKTERKAIDAPMAEFDRFFAEVNATAGFDNNKLQAILDGLRHPVESALHGKIDAVMGLKNHPNTPQAGTLEASLGAALLRRWRENTAFKVGYADVVPFFLLNNDQWFERGLWLHWPGMHWAQRLMHVNLLGMWHGPRWKFSSCDADGKARELYVYRSKPGEQKPSEEGGAADEKAEL